MCRPPSSNPSRQNINAVLISPPQSPVDMDLPAPTAVMAAGHATEHHQPRAVGRRRVDAVRGAAVRQRGARRHRPPHRGKQRLRAAGFGRDRPVDLRVPHPHAGLVRHRLQRDGRQVRPGLRGPGRRHGQAGRGLPHRRVQPQHLGRGDDRQLRRGAADPDPAAHHRPAAGLAAGHRPRRPAGARSCSPRRAARSPSFPRGATPTLPTIFTHRDVGNTDCPGNAAYAAMDRIRDIAARFNDPPGPEDLAESLRGGAIFTPVGVDGRNEQPARRADVAGGGGRGVDALRHVRQGRGLLVTGQRRRTRHRGDL